LTLESVPGLAGAAVAVTGAALALLTVGARRLPRDPPGPRSLHTTPTPRIGGMAIWLGFVPAATLVPPLAPGVWQGMLIALAAIAAISLADDWWGVHPVVRLAVHAFAAVGVAVLVGPPGAATALPVRWIAVGVAALALVWAANLFNFMDGNDGLAATMSVCGFGAYGCAAALAGAAAGAWFALAAAALAFLVVNLPPARMFMGDVGAVPLGFLAAAAGLAGIRAGTWPPWFPLLVFLPFIADATVTLAKRLAGRERVWEAHRSHYYQRLHRLGAGHRGTLLAFGVLIAGTAVSATATLALEPDSGWLVTAAWSAVVAAFFCGIDYHWRHRPPALR
jgi:UDP-N-acetylmuramyl pentapeptide phosphotransferase/UDP-N-acetylglucosamine-1-phosphate transferase